MVDKLTPGQRHECMAHIRAKDTRPEMIVRRWLWREGYRYRLHVRRLPGNPDIVLRGLKTVIFINGCFWHGHNVEDSEEAVTGGGVVELTDSECCRIPHTNREFWLKKIRNNRLRDRHNYAASLKEGWHVLVVWECMLKPRKREATLKALSQRLNNIFLEGYRAAPMPIVQQEDETDMAAEEELSRG